MKKIVTGLLAGMLLTGVVAAQDAKTLVVYYSATGTTKGIAEKIADVTGGTLFEIEPVKLYTDADLDWTDRNSRCSREHKDPSLRKVELKNTKVPNWASYDTVYIGFPIWWGIAAWPVDTFVKANDFSGKKVIPFCTAISSGVGRSDVLLKEMAKNGNWQKGEVFRRSASTDKIRNWVKTK